MEMGEEGDYTVLVSTLVYKHGLYKIKNKKIGP